MGRLLEEYIASNVPALEAIVGATSALPTEKQYMQLTSERKGQRQPEGAMTFPLAAEQPIQGQPIGPGGAPTGPMAAIPGPGGINPQAAATPSFEGEPVAAMPPVEGQQQPDRSGEFEAGPDSFAGMSNDADPEDIANATKAMEEGGVDIDEEYAKVTGSEPEKSEDDPKGESTGEGLTRQEKALILMEFGLNLMAQSGTGEGTLAGDIGIAGGAALGGHMTRKAARAKTLAEAEDKKLERELKRAQIEKAKKPKTSIKTVNGKLAVINEDSGEAEPILMDGKPVDADDADKLDFEIKRQAFIDAFDSQISDKEELLRRAAAFAAGVRGIAFPELARADAALMMRKELEKEPKQKWPVDGKEVRWEDLNQKQKTQVTREIVDGAYAAAGSGELTSTGGGGGGGGIEGLSAEEAAKMVPGKLYGLSDGRNAKLVNGVPTIID